MNVGDDEITETDLCGLLKLIEKWAVSVVR